MVRPERLRLSANGQGGPGALATTVDSVVFQGPVVRCGLRAADGTLLVAHVGPDQAVPALAPGQRLWVWWDADAACLLPPVDQPSELDVDTRSTTERATVNL